jgi:hypothetical protein
LLRRTTSSTAAATAATTLCWSRRSCRRRWIWYTGATAMAGPAFDLARHCRHGALLVDGLNHSHHLAGDELVLLILCRKIIAPILLNVTEGARHTQCRVDFEHFLDDLRPRHVFQHLDVNERLIGAATSALSATSASATAALRDHMTRDQKHHNCDYKNHACNPMGQLSHDPSFKRIILTRCDLFSDKAALCY